MKQDIYQEIVEARRLGRRIALATLIARKGSTPRKDTAKMLVYEDGSISGTIGGGRAEAEVCREAAGVIAAGRSQLLHFDLTGDDVEDSGLICGGTMEVYVEAIIPEPSLFVFGAGHVGRCLAETAANLGFRISVVDDRKKYAVPERFPSASKLYVDTWEKIFPVLPVNASSFIVIVTRGHQYDLACLRFALGTPARYIGLMGSRRKIGLFFEALEKEGVDAPGLERVYAPVGLEIGSETPEEIAISIAAELIAVRKNLDVRPWKEKLPPLVLPAE